MYSIHGTTVFVAGIKMKKKMINAKGGLIVVW